MTIVCLTMAMTVAYAEEAVPPEILEESSSIEYLEDGSYIVTTIQQRQAGGIMPRVQIGRIYVQEGYKKIDLYNSKDELEWTYTLIGTFKITTGVSVVCTDSTYTIEIYNDDWHMTAHDNSYAGSEAYGTATMKRKVMFITTNTCDIDATVGCDEYGNIG